MNFRISATLAVVLLSVWCPALAAAHSPHERTALALAHDDPMAIVYVVTSQKTFDAGVRDLAVQPQARRDSTGASLVMAQVRAHALEDISRHVHEREKRCGGYFAFATQAEAEAFIRGDKSAQAIAAPALVSYTIDNGGTVNTWLPQVQESRIRGAITHLSTQYRNRYYATATGEQSAQWIRDTWLALGNGRSDVSAELFNCANCSTQPSVILTVQGNELANEIVVLGGHLDSISNSGSGENMNAPGADDDASGIATLTEVIRVALASGWKPKRTVKFMGYAAEEVGLRGSNAIAQSFKNASRNVVGVLQLDMTNYRTGALDMRVITDYSSAPLKQFMTDVFDAYLAPTGLTRGTLTCGYGCSDHASWTSAGYPAAMMFESGRFPSIHTANDTLANVGGTADSSVPFAKLGLAFLGELAKTAGGSGGGGTAQTYTNAADFPINDNATVSSPIAVSGRTGNAPNNASVSVNIVHTYRGDLKVDLVAPDGSVYVLSNRAGGSADNLVATYPLNLSSEALNGTWNLRVNDNANADTGYINSWGVTF